MRLKRISGCNLELDSCQMELDYVVDNYVVSAIPDPKNIRDCLVYLAGYHH